MDIPLIGKMCLAQRRGDERQQVNATNRAVRRNSDGSLLSRSIPPNQPGNNPGQPLDVPLNTYVRYSTVPAPQYTTKHILAKVAQFARLFYRF